jgi:hypothetical protein
MEKSMARGVVVVVGVFLFRANGVLLLVGWLVGWLVVMGVRSVTLSLIYDS